MLVFYTRFTHINTSPYFNKTVFHTIFALVACNDYYNKADLLLLLLSVFVILLFSYQI